MSDPEQPLPSYLQPKSPPSYLPSAPTPKPSLLSLVAPSESLLGSKIFTPVQKTKVFIVHGHQEGLMYELSHHLRGENLETIILREELNKGRTIPEKLSDFADQAGYAVVLFTGDDEGRKKGASSWEPRARQNVVYEMGLFVGKLGRARVCAVVEPDVQLPSDLQGIVRIEYVTGGTWKHDVVREIKAKL